MGGELRGFAISLGVIGAAVAFSLQEVIAGAAGWVAITVGGYLHPGDRVQMGKVRGDVIDVGLFRTTLLEVGEWVRGDLYTGRIVRVSNGTVIREPVFNYSSDFPFLWDELTVPVTHASDWRQAHALLLAAAEAETSGFAKDVTGAWQEMVRRYLIEDARLTPLVTVEANDNWLEFTVRYVTDYRGRRTTKNAITQRILEALPGTNGTVRLASATFEVTGVPPLELRRGHS